MQFGPNRFGKIFVLGALIWTAGCANTSTDNTKDALNCLNTATPSNSQNCANMVSGQTAKTASLVRCASVLIRQGYSSSSLLQSVVSSLQSNSTSSTPNATAMTILGFHYYSGVSGTPVAADVTDATTAASECSNSASPGLSMLGGFAATSTNILYLASTGTSASGLLTYINNPANASTVASQPGVASALGSAYSSNCASGTTSSSYASFCTQYATAITNSGGSASSTATVTSFLSNLK
jgi:hypothetical protein